MKPKKKYDVRDLDIVRLAIITKLEDIGWDTKASYRPMQEVYFAVSAMKNKYDYSNDNKLYVPTKGILAYKAFSDVKYVGDFFVCVRRPLSLYFGNKMPKILKMNELSELEEKLNQEFNSKNAISDGEEKGDQAE